MAGSNWQACGVTLKYYYIPKTAMHVYSLVMCDLFYCIPQYLCSKHNNRPKKYVKLQFTLVLTRIIWCCWHPHPPPLIWEIARRYNYVTTITAYATATKINIQWNCIVCQYLATLMVHLLSANISIVVPLRHLSIIIWIQLVFIKLYRSSN